LSTVGTRTAEAGYRNAGGGVRARVWLRRYLPAEAVATSAALATALAAAPAGTEAAVVAAAWAETLAFYAFVTGQELRGLAGGWRSRRNLAAAGRGVVAEFGAAEAVDTLAVRPLLMYAFVAPLGSLLAGALVGKLAADVVFYALAIPAFELRARARR